MPIFELECQDCKHKFESLMKDKDEIEHAECPKCESMDLQFCFSLFGGYSIKGDNSASVRPKRAGSFKRKD
jgi:putative FmdB family regulatory protein